MEVAQHCSVLTRQTLSELYDRGWTPGEKEAKHEVVTAAFHLVVTPRLNLTAAATAQYRLE